jgi:hypothetical protein
MLLNDHVAEQNRINTGVGLDRTVSQWGATGAENEVGTNDPRCPSMHDEVDFG